MRHRDELVPLLEPSLGKTGGRGIAALEAVAVPCAPIRSIDEVFRLARGRRASSW